ncbi:MAG: reprolysin-like metallopeptidase [Verrucomicrobiota bacterium]
MAKAPKEFTPAARTTPLEISLPMPDGTAARFRVVESSVMAPELAAQFPEIKTYLGQGIDDPSASVRFDITPTGLHAQIISPHGAVYIDPYWRGDRGLHTSYYKRDYRKVADGFQCLMRGGAGPAVLSAQSVPTELQRSGANLRTYRLACAATGEYVQFHGGTVSAGMSAIVTAINRVTGIYEVEMAIRLVLVTNNNLLVYTNANTDPYSNANPSSLLTQNQSNIDGVIGSANYDIGHVFSTGGGGLALLGVACSTGFKAQGETGLSAPIGDGFYIDYVAHEIGHQFGGNHTFNSELGSCGGGNRNPPTAFEPGSGSTIMPYAGICGSDNLQGHSDPYFHSVSFDEILAYSTSGSGNTCPVLTSTGNNAPIVNAGANYSIPKSTPFTLTATGTDPDGDVLSYCWEERDIGTAQTLSDPDNGSSPLFRSFSPTNSPARIFPRLSDILANTITPGEKLPTTTRTMNFRVTARDNRAGGGGVNTSNMTLNVIGTAGPFVVTAPNTAVSWSGTRIVTWNVAGTTAAPINTGTVNILLSTNGGLSFPIVLANNTPNDGSETIVLPNLTTSTARIKIEAAGNVFFDISDANFSITSAIPAPNIQLFSTSLATENCLPTNNAIDPGETVTLNFVLKNTGTLNTTNLVATLLAGTGVVSPSGAQAYGVLNTNGTTVSRQFTFTANGACGASIQPTLQLQDGSSNLGTVSVSFTLGQGTALFITNFNATAIAIPGSGSSGPSFPYPSSIVVSNISAPLAKVTVTLTDLSHSWPADLDILLVAPNGQSVMLMSDAGDSLSITNVTLTFDSATASPVPELAKIVSGTFRPTNYAGVNDLFNLPAPPTPYGNSLSIFNGLVPNGTWSLYIMDDAAQDVGSLTKGWSLTFTTVGADCCHGNTPPSLAAMTNRTIYAGGNLIFTNTASDIDVPTNSFTYSFDLFAAGAQLNSGTGVFTWTPAQNQIGTNNFTIRVTDNGSPSLSDTKSFSVIVVTPPRIENVARTNSQITLTWVALSGRTYRVQYKTDLNQLTWIDLSGDVTANSTTASKNDTIAATGSRFYRILVLP